MIGDILAKEQTECVQFSHPRITIYRAGSIYDNKEIL